MSTLPERIQAGIEFWDAHFGDRSWVNRLDLDKFDMSDPHWCLIGQLITANLPYYNKRVGLGITRSQSYDLAFNLDEDWFEEASYEEVREEYAILTREWLAALTGELAGVWNG